MRNTTMMCFAVACLLALTISPASRAQPYPAKAVRLVVPFATGSTTDTLSRLIGQRISGSWGQPVIADNRPGAGGNIGTEQVARSTPDGYTLLMVAGSHAINPSLYAKLPFDPVKDFAPITLVARAPLVIVTHPSLPVRSLPELLKFAKARPGQLNYASGGAGSPSHLVIEYLRSAASVELVHVPYKGGGSVLSAILSGEVTLMAGGLLVCMPQVRAGKLRAVAVTGSNRSPAAPDVPTVAESALPGYEASGWWGLLAPRSTPAEIVEVVQRETARVVQAKDFSDRLAADGIEPIGSSSQAFARFIVAEIDKWERVVRASGAKAQ